MTRSRSPVAVVAALACATGLLAATGASAAPSTPRTLVYELTNCEGPAGTPTSMTGLKQPGEAAALHLTNGLGNFMFMKSVDASGTVEFETRGFDHNNLPTVTCDLEVPVTHEEVVVTGLVSGLH